MSLPEGKVIATIPRGDREQTRIGLSEYKGRVRVDVRVWYVAADGEYRPSKSGISMLPEQLPALLEALTTARDELATSS